MVPDKHGTHSRYQRKDLHYDLKHHGLVASVPVADATDERPEPPTPSLHYRNNQVSVSKLQWFTANAAESIAMNADMHPLVDDDPSKEWEFEVQFQSGSGSVDTGRYRMRHSLHPHRGSSDNFVSGALQAAGEYVRSVACAVSDSIGAGKCIPDKGIIIPSHSCMRKVNDYARRTDILRAIAAEYGGLDDRGVWELVELPKGAVAHPIIMLVKVKHLPSGAEDKVKARAVMRGDQMISGRDFGETFAPTAQLSTVRCMLADAIQHCKFLKTIDIKQAFTSAGTDRPTYIRQPPGRSLHRGPDGNPLVYLLKRNLYGSPSAPRAFSLLLHETLIDAGFVQSHADTCMYVRVKNGKRLVVLAYVDDLLCSFSRGCTASSAMYKEFVAALTTRFDLQDDGMTDATAFLGMQFAWSFVDGLRSLAVSMPAQLSYVLELLGITDAKPARTPGTPGSTIKLADSPPAGPEGGDERKLMASRGYRSVVGSLLWLSRVFRVDIAQQVNACARVGHNPGDTHWQALKHVGRYLLRTPEHALTYTTAPDPELVGWCDSDYSPETMAIAPIITAAPPAGFSRTAAPQSPGGLADSP